MLRQQLVFVEQLSETGMLSKREAELMEAPIDMRIRKLAHTGPVWRAPLTSEVLHSIPILREVCVIQHGIVIYTVLCKGQAICLLSWPCTSISILLLGKLSGSQSRGI